MIRTRQVVGLATAALVAVVAAFMLGGDSRSPGTAVERSRHDPSDVAADPRRAHTDSSGSAVRRNPLPAGAAHLTTSGAPTAGVAEVWRIRVVDRSGAPVARYRARWLSHDSLATPAARAFATQHEGQRQTLFEQLGAPLEPDASGILNVPWQPRASAVGVAVDDSFGAVQLDGRPVPDEVLILRLEAVARCTVHVVSADGQPRAGVRVDALWYSAEGPERTPLGVTDPRGQLAVTSDIATVRYVLDETRSSLELGIGIPGHGPGITLPAAATWPAEATLRCEPLGTLEVRAVAGDHDLDQLRASCRLWDAYSPAGRAFASAVEGRDQSRITVAVDRVYAFEIVGGERVHATGTVVGPPDQDDTAQLSWIPSGLCTFLGRIPAPPEGRTDRGATVRLDAADDQRFPRVRRVALDDAGRFRLTVDVAEIAGVQSLLLIDEKQIAFGPVAVKAEAGVRDLGMLPVVHSLHLADLLVQDSEGALVVGAEAGASAPASIRGTGGRFTVSSYGTSPVALVHIDAPGFAAASIRVEPSREPVVVTLERTRQLTVEARIDAELDERLLRSTLVPRGRRSESLWARVTRVAVDTVRFEWDAAPDAECELSILTVAPPRELRRSIVDVHDTTARPDLDLRGQQLSRWTIVAPTTPVHLIQADVGSALYLDGSVLDPAAGDLVLEAPTVAVFVRRGSPPVLRTLVPGEDVRIAFPTPARLEARWSDAPNERCLAEVRLVDFAAAQAWHAPIRVWREDHVRRVSLEDLVGAASRGPADGFPLYFDGTYTLATLTAPPSEHLEVVVDQSVPIPRQLSVTR